MKAVRKDTVAESHDPARPHYKTITRDELSRRLSSGEVLQVINVLESRKGERLLLIRGSRNIPRSELEKRMDELDRNRPVVLYCANKECTASRKAAGTLLAHDFGNVFVYEGGIQEWKASGLPVIL